MSPEEFKKLPQPWPEFSAELRALWYDAQGNWDQAHRQVDQLSGKSASRVHAYLHRKEGDQWNADYWYRRSEATRPGHSLEEEWEALVKEHLAHVK